jgi:ribonuclease HI
MQQRIAKKNRMGVGLIGRDSGGTVRVASCSYMPYLTDPEKAEAFAACQGVELCRFMGYNAVILEGDAQGVVKALTVADVIPKNIDCILADTRLLLDSISQWQVLFIRRTGNVAAHRLARMALQQNVSQVWFESFSSFISEVVCKDIVSYSDVNKCQADFKKKKNSTLNRN